MATIFAPLPTHPGSSRQEAETSRGGIIIPDTAKKAARGEVSRWKGRPEGRQGLPWN